LKSFKKFQGDSFSMRGCLSPEKEQESPSFKKEALWEEKGSAKLKYG